VIIGAFAFPVHGYDRATLDVDIFIAPDRENAARVWEALRQTGYDVTDLTVDDLLTKKVLLRQYVVEADIHPFVAGVTFEEVWRDRIVQPFGSVQASFASLASLIKMKEAAGRPKDLEDLRRLRALAAKPSSLPRGSESPGSR